MTSIPSATCKIYRNIFKRYYLRNKILFWFFISFLICVWNLDHFQKKDEYPSLIICEIIDAERRGYLKV